MNGKCCRQSNAIRPRAFSLIELIVVLVIVSFIAAMVTVRWSGLYRKPMMGNAVERLKFVDSHMRMYALRHRRSCGLAIDLRNNRLQKRYHARDSQNPRWEPLGRNLEIVDLIGPAIVREGDIVIVNYRPDGGSVSYGVQLAGVGQQEVFLVVAGLSGQFTQYDRKADFDDVSEMLENQ